MKNLFMVHIDHGVFRSVSREKALEVCRRYDGLDHSARIDELAISVGSYELGKPDREYVYSRGDHEFRRFNINGIPGMFEVKT